MTSVGMGEDIIGQFSTLLSGGGKKNWFHWYEICGDMSKKDKHGHLQIVEQVLLDQEVMTHLL